MSWADEVEATQAAMQGDVMRQTGTDWLYTISEADQYRADRRVTKARRKINKAERKYLRRMRGHEDGQA
jgi:hypothetical protein